MEAREAEVRGLGADRKSRGGLGMLGTVWGLLRCESRKGPSLQLFDAHQEFAVLLEQIE